MVLKRLGDYVKIKTGKLDANASSENGKYPFFTCSVNNLWIDNFAYDCECVLIAGNGDLNVKYYEGKFNAYQRTYIVESNDKSVLDVRFLYYFMSKYIDILRNNSIGGVIKYIKLGDLTDALIPIPPLESQEKIVEVLDKAQGLIDARKEQIRLMDELIQSLFYEMFGDPVTNPKGWEVRTVEKVCTNIMGGGTPSKSNLDFYVGDIPWVTPKDMKIDFISDSMDHINEDAINNSSAKLIPENSVLMVIRSGILKRKLPVAINKRCVAVNQDMKAFVINKNFTNSEFFMYFWKSCENYILPKVRAVTADNIEFKQIKDMQYILPPCELQNEFSEKVQQIQTNKTLLEMSLCELENNLSGLMQSAFAGSLFDDLVVGK